MILHVFDKRPLDWRAIPSHLNYFQVVVQHGRILAGPGCSLKIQAQPSDILVHFGRNGWNGCMAEIQPFSAQNSAVFSHFQTKFCHFQISAIFSHFGWKWLNFWLFKRGTSLVANGAAGCRGLEKISQHQSKKQPFSTKPVFGLVALYLSRG